MSLAEVSLEDPSSGESEGCAYEIENAMRVLEAVLTPLKDKECDAKEFDKALARIRAALECVERNFDGGDATYVFAGTQFVDAEDPESDGCAANHGLLRDGLTSALCMPDRARTMIAYLSCGEPLRRQDWMSAKACEDFIRSSYAVSFADRLRSDDADARTPLVRAAIRHAFGPGIDPNKMFGKSALPAAVSRDLWESLLTLLAYDLSMALQGRHGDVLGKAFAKLAGAVPHAIPLGSPPSTPRNNPWVVAIG